jgi:RHS repeat-associated protein
VLRVKNWGHPNNQLTGYTYDVAGNMVNDGAHAYTFDAENRILKVDSTAAAYTYNPLGNRVRKDVGAASTEYFYFGSEIIAELNPATGVFTNYVYFNGQRVARRDPSGSVFYYFTDLVHSSSVVTDSGGTIKAESDYYPWGGELQLVNNDTNHYKFSGKERDSESQLDFFGARYYGNRLGRFVTPDWDGKPVTVPYAEFGDPQSLNLYSYVRNSPVARVNADGHMIVGFSGNGIFSAGRQGVDDGSGGLADGDNPYADADRVLFVNAQGMYVVKPNSQQQGKNKQLRPPDANHNHRVTVRSLSGQNGNPAGHVTVQVDNGPEVGFDPAKDMTKTEIVENKAVPGKVEPRAQGVSTLDAVTIYVTKDEAGKAQSVIDARTKDPGNYQYIGRSCVDFAEDVVRSTGAKAPHDTLPSHLIRDIRSQQMHDKSTQAP